jgi:hypothetical protein
MKCRNSLSPFYPIVISTKSRWILSYGFVARVYGRREIMYLTLLTLQVSQLTIDNAPFSLAPVTDSFKCSITSGFECPNLRCQVSDDAVLSVRGCAEHAIKAVNFIYPNTNQSTRQKTQKQIVFTKNGSPLYRTSPSQSTQTVPNLMMGALEQGGQFTVLAKE